MNKTQAQRELDQCAREVAQQTLEISRLTQNILTLVSQQAEIHAKLIELSDSPDSPKYRAKETELDNNQNEIKQKESEMKNLREQMEITGERMKNLTASLNSP